MSNDDDLTRPIKREMDSGPRRPAPRAPTSGSNQDDMTRRPGSQSTNVPEGYDPMERPVVGWLVVVEGVGKGSALPLTYGQNSVGRGPEADVRLVFSPGPIHQEDVLIEDQGELRLYRNEKWSTAVVRYDPKVSRYQFNIIYDGRASKQFYIDRSSDAGTLTYIKKPGRDELVRSDIELEAYARIIAGDTELLFVPLCRPQTDDDRGFDWQG